jgi:WD40 repeat protein
VRWVDGSAGHPITDFQSQQVWSLSFSPDGKSLAVLRGHDDSDVVLLQEAKWKITLIEKPSGKTPPPTAPS